MTTAIRSLEVRLHDVLVGYLTHYPDERTLFVVDNAYLEYGGGRPTISLSMVRPGDEHLTRQLLLDERNKSSLVKAPPFFSNLLPEGGLRRRIAAELKIHEDREFDLLAALGRDLPGAVILTPAKTPDHLPGRRSAFDGAPSVPPEMKFSLGGMQLKFSMLRQGDRFTLPGATDLGDYIVKPPSSDYHGLPMIEAAAMKTARAVGIETPEVMLVPPDHVDDLTNFSGFRPDEPFYAVRRFDRVDQGQGERRHIEDFAQVFNLRTSEKYGHANYEQIGRTLLQYAGGVDDLREMARRLVFNVLMGNGDAHVKNWSLLYADRRLPRLSPAYDLVPTIAYTTMDQSIALNMGGIKQFPEISLHTFDVFLRRVGILDRAREDLMETVITTGRGILVAWEGLFMETGVPPRLIQRIHEHQRSLQLSVELGG